MPRLIYKQRFYLVALYTVIVIDSKGVVMLHHTHLNFSRTDKDNRYEKVLRIGHDPK